MGFLVSSVMNNLVVNQLKMCLKSLQANQAEMQLNTYQITLWVIYEQWDLSYI